MSFPGREGQDFSFPGTLLSTKPHRGFIKAGKMVPEGFNAARPWDYIYAALATDGSLRCTPRHWHGLRQGAMGCPRLQQSSWFRTLYKEVCQPSHQSWRTTQARRQVRVQAIAERRGSGGKEEEKMEKIQGLQRVKEERKEGAKEAQGRNASLGTMATRHVGTWHRSNNVQQR